MRHVPFFHLFGLIKTRKRNVQFSFSFQAGNNREREFEIELHTWMEFVIIQTATAKPRWYLLRYLSLDGVQALLSNSWAPDLEATSMDLCETVVVLEFIRSSNDNRATRFVIGWNWFWPNFWSWLNGDCLGRFWVVNEDEIMKMQMKCQDWNLVTAKLGRDVCSLWTEIGFIPWAWSMEIWGFSVVFWVIAGVAEQLKIQVVGWSWSKLVVIEFS